jgi:hypothetical protein
LITEWDIKNVKGDTLQLPLLSSSNGFAVREITGLNPVNATITTSNMAQLDGAQFQNANRTTRNITAKIGLTPNFVDTTVDSLRQTLMNYLMPKSYVTMTFWKDGVQYATTTGYVEDFSNAMFSADPEVDLSILCMDPDFYALSVTNFAFNTVDTTDNTALTYSGNSDCGVVLTLNINRSLSSFTLYNLQPDATFTTFAVTGTFLAGDVFTINSIPGQKAATLTRAGVTTSALALVDATNMQWPVLQPGVSEFRVQLGDSGASIPGNIAYTAKYGGL